MEDPRVRARVRRTAWWLTMIAVALLVGSACFILFNGHKSRTVLHSRDARATGAVEA